MTINIDQTQAQPTGTNVLIQVKFDHIQRRSKGGIVFAPETVEGEEKGSQVSQILALGPMAFDDYPPETPHPEVGDWVSHRRYPGYQVGAGPISDSDKRLQELRICNDREIVAVFPATAITEEDE